MRGAHERRAFDAAAEIYVFGTDGLVWDGDTVRLSEPDERTLLLLAEPGVPRALRRSAWPCDPLDADDEW